MELMQTFELAATVQTKQATDEKEVLICLAPESINLASLWTVCAMHGLLAPTCIQGTASSKFCFGPPGRGSTDPPVIDMYHHPYRQPSTAQVQRINHPTPCRSDPAQQDETRIDSR